ncbi:sugar transferase [Actinomycetospora sp. TBRC 11914]|uniref:sugar transferase n=1 Tax=Actinomycetospora sp. TBRC 11914 TaxID=2729387 RepID=UPI00145EF8A8|nr:sugar transferase [Actinomycetospora sp. TBRC 11914]NMO92386.1 UDP-phosphate galactose phosphotransferase [Actinomycetospora sp. TBRC 11914]
MTAAPEEKAARREPRTPPRAPARADGVAVLVGVLDGAAAAVAAALVGVPGVLAIGYGLVVVGVLAADGSYRPRITTLVGPRVPRLVAATALPLPLLVLLADRSAAPWVPVAAVAAAGVLVAAVRAGLGVAQRRRRRRTGGEPALVVGAGPTGLRLAGLMRARPELGLHPLGILDDAGAAVVGDAGPAWLGRVADLPDLVRRLGVRRVVVAFPAAQEPAAPEEAVPGPVPPPALPPVALEDAVRAAREAGARVWVVPRLPRSGLDVPLGRLDDLWGTALVPLRPIPDDASPTRRLGRTGEVLIASVLLVLTGPLVLLAALLGGPGRLAGPGPAFFRQWRVGRAGVPVRVVKLRSVVGDGEQGWAVPDRGVTPWGRLLRRTHVDELPQLLGVLRGDLALVGPRPERPVFAALFARTVPGYLDRLRVRAGLTGWAQVHGLCGDTSLDDRARFDSQYVEYRSLWLDAVILLRTLAALPAAPARAPHTTGGHP